MQIGVTHKECWKVWERCCVGAGITDSLYLKAYTVFKNNGLPFDAKRLDEWFYKQHISRINKMYSEFLKIEKEHHANRSES